MSGYVFAMGECLRCRRIFSFNPHFVPSSSAVTGSREPLCRDCINDLNKIRIKRGLKPWKIHPDAYEALPEEEL